MVSARGRSTARPTIRNDIPADRMHGRIYGRSSADVTIKFLDHLIGTAQDDSFSKSKRIAAVQA
jgi:hypothetical protein